MIEMTLAICRPTFIFPLLAATVSLAGCGGGFEQLPVARTIGRVVCDGKPVPNARVYFEPLFSGEKGKAAGKQGLGGTDNDGKFTISTYGTNDGAVVGAHRVRVDAMGQPCDCVNGSEIDAMNVTIVKGKVNEFEVVLKKKDAASTGNPVETGPTFSDDEFDREEDEAWEAEMKAKKGG